MLAHTQYREAIQADGEAIWEAIQAAHELEQSTPAYRVEGRNAFGPGSDEWWPLQEVASLVDARTRQHEEAAHEDGFDFTRVVDLATGKVVL